MWSKFVMRGVFALGLVGAPALLIVALASFESTQWTVEDGVTIGLIATVWVIAPRVLVPAPNIQITPQDDDGKHHSRANVIRSYVSVSSVPLALFVSASLGLPWQGIWIALFVATCLAAARMTLSGQDVIGSNLITIWLAHNLILTLLLYPIGLLVAPHHWLIGLLIAFAFAFGGVVVHLLHAVWFKEAAPQTHRSRTDGSRRDGALVHEASAYIITGLIIAAPLEVERLLGDKLWEAPTAMITWIVLSLVMAGYQRGQTVRAFAVYGDVADRISESVAKGDMSIDLARTSILVMASRVTLVSSAASCVTVTRLDPQGNIMEKHAAVTTQSVPALPIRVSDMIGIRNDQSTIVVDLNGGGSILLRAFDRYHVQIPVFKDVTAAIKYAVKSAIAETIVATSNVPVGASRVDLDSGLVSAHEIGQRFELLAEASMRRKETVSVVSIRLIDQTGITPTDPSLRDELMRATRYIARRTVGTDEVAMMPVQVSVLGPGKVCMIVGNSGHGATRSVANEALTRRIESGSLPLITETGYLSLHLSVGIATGPREGQTFRDLFGKADARAQHLDFDPEDPWLDVTVAMDRAANARGPVPILVPGWSLTGVNGDSQYLIRLLQAFAHDGTDLSTFIIVPDSADVPHRTVVDEIRAMGVKFGVLSSHATLDSPLNDVTDFIVTRGSAKGLPLGHVMSRQDGQAIRRIAYA